MRNLTKIAIAVAISVPVMSSYAAKNADGEKIDLSGIEARLAALEAIDADTRLSGLEGIDAESRLTALETPPTNEGTYTVTIMEAQHWGCQTLPENNLGLYLQEQAQSSFSSRSATYDAISAGGVLSIPAYELRNHEMLLSGVAIIETPPRIEGNSQATIDGDGVISFDAGPDVVFSGQFSDDGSTFTLLAQGSFIEGTCNDNFMVMGVGVRK